MKVTEWENEIKMERKQKDIFFSSHPQSPILAEKKLGFEWLNKGTGTNERINATTLGSSLKIIFMVSSLQGKSLIVPNKNLSFSLE
jgi:hypothetical protein